MKSIITFFHFPFVLLANQYGIKQKLFSLLFMMFTICTFANTINSTKSTNLLVVPVLGNYPNITIAHAGGNSIVTPDAVPTGTTTITAYTDTNFKGKITVSPSTGVVNITNAYPAGTYTVTVNAGSGVLKTFSLTVGNPLCSNNPGLPSSGFTMVGNNHFGNKIGDFNNDGHQDYVTYGYKVNATIWKTINIYFGDGMGGFNESTLGDFGRTHRSFSQNLTVDDFTGDGNLDVAITYMDAWSDSFVKIFEGDGAGSLVEVYKSEGFTAHYDFTEVYPLIKSVDLNNDGNKDLIVGSLVKYSYWRDKSYFIHTYIGNGAGSFSSSYYYTNDLKGNMAIGDFDQDGNQDFFASNSLNINGVITAIAANSEIPGRYLEDGVVGDFNGDGDQDLVCLTQEDKLYVLLGTNIPDDATFGSPNEIVVDSSTLAIAVGDLNGDGYQDIVSGGLNNVTIHYGNGDGAFETSISLAVTGQVYSLSLADFNEDGYTDLFVNGSVLILERPKVKVLGKGIAMVNGSAAPTKVNNTDFEGVVNGTTKANEFTITNKVTTTLTSIDIIGADAASFSITGIDLSSPVTLVNDGSKKFSIVFNPALYAAGVKKATIQINYSEAGCYPIEFEVQGTALICSPGTLATPTKMAFTSTGHAMSIAKGDFNEDGNQDLGVLFMSDDETDVVSINLGDGNGVFFESTEVPLEAGNDAKLYESYSYESNTVKIKVGDFNGDGHLDLVIPTYDSKITLLYGDGAGNFPTKKDIPLIFTNNSGQFSKEVTVGEFNGDGIPDFGVEVYSDGKSDITNIVLSTSSASYTVSTLSIYRDEYNDYYPFLSKGMVIEDIDKDGFQDIVAIGSQWNASNTPEFFFIKGNGDGTFTEGTQRFFTNSDRSTSFSFALDFNKDGNLDIVASYDNNVFIYTGDGAGNFVKTTDVSLYDAGANMSVGDLNGDDNMDFIMPTWDVLLGWYGDAIGSFGNETQYGYNVEFEGWYTDTSIADLNNDGVQDVIASDNSRGVYVYLGDKGVEINLQGNANDIVSGDDTPVALDATDFGDVTLNTAITKTYTIQNTGNSDLTISSISISGTDEADFVLDGIALPATITANTSSTFILTFSSTSSGEKTATVTLNNDDCDEGIYTFAVKSWIATTWTGAVSTAWDLPGNWSNNIVPITTNHVIIPNVVRTPDITVPVQITNLTIEALSSFNISASGSVKVDGNLSTAETITMKSDENNSGVLLVKGTSNGQITYERGGLQANKWSLVTAPVSGQSVKEFVENVANNIRVNTTVTPNRYAVAYYDDSKAVNEKWVYYTVDDLASNSITFEAGKGYIVSRETDGVVTFTGTLTTNSLDKTVTPSTWNAIGNPYTTFYPINENNDDNFILNNLNNFEPLNTAVYTWDNAQNKYIAVSLLDNARSLPAGQGFFMKTKSDVSSILFNEDKRQVQPVSGTSIFGKSTNSIISLKLIASTNNINVTTAIKYFSTATKGLDPGADIGNFGGSSFDVYTKLLEGYETESFTIQSLPNSEYDAMIVSVGLKASIGSEVTFSLEALNLPADIKVFLEDKQTNELVRLDQENTKHTVTLTEEVDGIGRFYLHTQSNVLNIEDFEVGKNIKIYVSEKNNLRIEGLKETKDNTSIKMYNLLGIEIFKTTFETKGINDVEIKNLSSGVYLIQLKNSNGIINRKIIFEY
jgi:hypothetical protein